MAEHRVYGRRLRLLLLLGGVTRRVEMMPRWCGSCVSQTVSRYTWNDLPNANSIGNIGIVWFDSPFIYTCPHGTIKLRFQSTDRSVAVSQAIERERKKKDLSGPLELQYKSRWFHPPKEREWEREKQRNATISNDVLFCCNGMRDREISTTFYCIPQNSIAWYVLKSALTRGASGAVSYECRHRGMSLTVSSGDRETNKDRTRQRNK